MPEAKILIVDDTRANLVALQVLLKPVEANVLIAESGQQALLLAAENREHIALILLDVLMPVMDGFEVARLLNENENTRSIPIIFITADQDDAHIEARSGQVVSAEALLRWYSADLGQVFPDEFIPAAESAGLIAELGCWVLKQAVATGAHWQRRFGIELRIAVNASSIQFRNNLLFDTIKEQFVQGYYFGKPMPQEDFLMA
jgi:CheY-like chemotaxis protein